MAAVTRFFLAIGLAWNNNAHWSASSNGAGGASYPVAGDTAIFDDFSGNCTLTANAAALLLKLGDTGGAYTGTFNANASDVALGTGGLDCTDGTGATISMGTNSTWTITGGTFDYSAIGTIIRVSSTVEFNGTCVWNAKSGQLLHDVTVASGAVVVATAFGGISITVVNVLDVTGKITVTAGDQLNPGGGADIHLRAGAVIDGGGDLVIAPAVSGHGLLTYDATASIETAAFRIDRPVSGGVIVPGAFPPTTIVNFGSGNKIWEPNAGTYTFESLVLRAGGSAGSSMKIDTTVNPGATLIVTGTTTFLLNNDADVEVDDTGVATNWTFQGDVVHTEGAGAIIWTPGSGTITLSGTVAQNIDFGGLTVEAIVIDNASGTVTFGDALTTAAFTAQPNASIAGAVSITVQRNFALNGTSGNEITFNGPDLDVTGTAVAHFTTATDSDASAGTKVTATDNCVDGTGNTNWDFSIEAFRYYYDQQEATA